MIIHLKRAHTDEGSTSDPSPAAKVRKALGAEGIDSMHESMRESGNSFGWFLTLSGNVLVYCGDHGMATLGVVSVLYGMGIQYLTYRLRIREVRLKEAEEEERRAERLRKIAGGA